MQWKTAGVDSNKRMFGFVRVLNMQNDEALDDLFFAWRNLLLHSAVENTLLSPWNGPDEECSKKNKPSDQKLQLVMEKGVLRVLYQFTTKQVRYLDPRFSYWTMFDPRLGVRRHVDILMQSCLGFFQVVFLATRQNTSNALSSEATRFTHHILDSHGTNSSFDLAAQQLEKALLGLMVGPQFPQT